MKLNKITIVMAIALLTSGCSGFIKKYQENVVVDSYGYSELKDKKFIKSLKEGKTKIKFVKNKLGEPSSFTPHAEQSATTLAIALSALTSTLAFGMLSFSTTPIISSFGQTIAIGLCLAYCLSWLRFDGAAKPWTMRCGQLYTCTCAVGQW